MSTNVKRASVAQRPISALELRLKDQFKGSDLFEEAGCEHDDDGGSGNNSLNRSRKTYQHEEEESRVRRRREESTCISSTRKRTSCLLGGTTSTISSHHHQAAAASSAAAAATTTSRTLTSRRSQDGQLVTATSSSSSMQADMAATAAAAAHHSFRTSASLLLSDNNNENDRRTNTATAALGGRSFLGGRNSTTLSVGGLFPTNEADFSSPDARSIFREVGSEFAMLESAMIDSTPSAPYALRTSRISKRPLSPLLGSTGAGNHLALTAPASDDISQSLSSTNNKGQLSKFSNSLSKLSARLNGHQQDLDVGGSTSANKNSSERIKELLGRVQEKPATATTDDHDDDNNHPDVGSTITSQKLAPLALPLPAGRIIQDESRKIFMSESIERIDQRMSNLCVKLQQSKDSKEAIDLLKIIIQMIEKAWSVPVCGDDLGFKLCNSLREAGGLDFVLGFIQDTVESLMRTDCLVFSPGPRSLPPSEPSSIISELKEPPTTTDSTKSTNNSSAATTNNGAGGGGKLSLKLDLRKVSNQQDSESSEGTQSTRQTVQTKHQNRSVSAPIRDNDSDIITSVSGLDSSSVESLSSYVSPLAGGPIEEGLQANKTSEQREDEQELKEEEEETSTLNNKSVVNEEEENKEETRLNNEDLGEVKEEKGELEDNNNSEQQAPAAAEIEEPAFLCARLLSQCLTSENRDYIVRNVLDSVIRLACSFSTIKSSRIHRLLTCGSTSSASIEQSKEPTSRSATETTTTTAAVIGKTEQAKGEPKKCEHNEHAHAVIGTEILQHLFKHSEETCHRMISLGGLQAILYGCRSSNIEVLRHCASALANLALYGGPEGQQRMIEQKAHVWLFPLAFNEDDNVQYYACLAIVVLVANKEIEADVLKSSSLDLVEPFVLSHEPQRFAESTTAHIHGQSASWLRKLIPLLESKRQEARNLACFHFAMEAHIKREQSQTQLFREIGAVEPLRKVGSSPQAIASRFACQALRLIGEKEPHKLSQQVPLWTSEDVVEWVSQIGFEQFRPAFVESRVDGDLLLQLDEEALKSDIGIDNGIIRRRFLRELTNLKRISDYSSIDKTGLCSMLTSQNSGQEFIQYIYPLLQLGVTKDTVHLFDCEQLLRECKVANWIHQIRLAQAIKEIQERQALEAASQECLSQNGQDQKTLDVFVSYRRSTGSQLASLLKVHLQLRGFSVFIDVERLEAGKFDNNLLDSIKAAKNFIIVLSPSALDRCVDDHGCKDWVHKEIVAALASGCNIIPIIDNFHWPDPEQLPEDMRSIIYFNGVRWIHDYQDACIDKVERFIRGEINISGQFSGGSQLGGAGGGSTAQSSLQRLSGGAGPTGMLDGRGNGSTYSISSPSVAATPSLGCGGCGGGGGGGGTGIVGTHSPNPYQFSRPPPFDGYHHPLSYISQQLQQHSQQTTASGGSRLR